MKIQIKIGEIELTYEGGDSNDYPKIVTTDRYRGDMTKSDRLMEVIKEMTNEAIKIFNETCK